MITSNVIYRVFKIRFDTITGTAFTIEHLGKQYLITAKHLIEHRKYSTIEVYFRDSWRPLSLRLIGASDKADIVVFASETQLSTAFDFPATAAGLIYGQDVYFVGFPYDVVGDVGELNQGRPLPLVKKACLSAFTVGTNGEGILLLDAHNNPGFSGAPVVFREPNSALLNVCGVVSGYLRKPESIQLDGDDQEYLLWLNSGIVVCSDIRHAIEEVEKNPNGLDLGRR